MKAILLSAGLGTRLKPLTDNTPKCLLPINGVPLLYRWIYALEKCGIKEVLINTHYLSDQVEKSIESIKKTKINLRLAFEETLLGTAGTVWNNQKFICDESCVIINADTITKFDIKKMLRFHLKYNPLATLGYYSNDNPVGCGLIKLENNTVIRFEEKPDLAFSNLVYAGLLIINNSIFEKLPFLDKKDNCYKGLDFGYDVFPNLIGSMIGFKINEPIIDIGDVNTYNNLKDQW